MQRTLVGPNSSGTGPVGGSATPLSPWDQITAVTVTCRAWGFPCRIDEAALGQAVQMLIEDVPAFAGRLGRIKGGRLRLADLRIEHTGSGAVLAVAEHAGLTLADVMDPDSWPKTGVTAADPKLSLYIEPMSARKMLAGKEPLVKVKLTRLADGDILGITCAHVLLDGMRWPALLAHLSTRYRQCVQGTTGGTELQPDAGALPLLHMADRRQLSLEHFMCQQQKQQGDGANITPVAPPNKLPAVRGSLLGYWRLTKALVARWRQRMELIILHVPAEAVAGLKQTAAAGNPGTRVSTGDAVQAAAGLLIHAACGRPLLPVAPKAMAVMVQLPTPPDFFGNAVRMLNVSLPAGTQQPAAGDPAAALCQLAGAIRRATTAFRTQLEEMLEAMQEVEALTQAPLLRMLCHVYGDMLSRLTSGTNYVPEIELGLGPSTYAQQLSVPRSPDVAVIRPSVPPYAKGFFLQVCLLPAHAAALRRLPLLQQLLPGARFVGA